MAPLTARTALTAWQFAPLVSGALILLAVGYAGCAVRVRQRHRARPWPAVRLAAFFAGLGVVAVATESSIGAYDDVLFSDHMVQHVLLIMVAPPLLVTGRPITLLLHAWGSPLHTWVKRALRSPAAAAVTWPPATTLLYCAVVAGTHTPPVMDLVLRNDAVHNAEHAAYLVTGYLFFLPVIGSEPIRWRMSVPGRFVVMLIAMMTDSFTGIVFTFQSREVFAAYAATPRRWAPSLIADLHLGGAVMFIGSDIAMAAVAVAIAVAFVRAHHLGRDVRWAGRGSALSRQLAAAGIPRSAGQAARHGDGGDADLAAYNVYLRSLSGQHGARMRRGGAGSG